MSKTVAWETSEVRGPKVAYTVKSENISRMLKRFKRVLIVIGGASKTGQLDGADIPNFSISLANILKGTLAISPGSYKAFTKHNKVVKVNISLVDLVNRIIDKQWAGFDAQGKYDLIIFIGGLYFFQSMILSTIKHFAPKQRTISLDQYYHPNAEFSLENQTPAKWKEGLDTLIQGLESQK